MAFRQNDRGEKEAYCTDKHGIEIKRGAEVTYFGDRYIVSQSMVGAVPKIAEEEHAETVLIKAGEDERRVRAKDVEIVAS